jgi:hypothetical protein
MKYAVIIAAIIFASNAEACDQWSWPSEAECVQRQQAYMARENIEQLEEIVRQLQQLNQQQQMNAPLINGGR